MGHALLDRKEFWYAMCGLIAFIYLVALALLAMVGAHNSIVRLALLMIAVHVLELPLAFQRLAARQPDAARVVPLTLLFGAAWWVPAQRGIFRAG